MLNYKKPAFWIILIAIVVCIVIAVCFFTSPKDEENGNYLEGSIIEEVKEDNNETETNESDVPDGPVSEPKIYYYEGNNFRESVHEGGKISGLIEFWIYLDENGQCVWYETPISSYVGHGNYTIKDGILVFSTQTDAWGNSQKYEFRIYNDRLEYIAAKSDKFTYADVKDGEAFYLKENVQDDEWPPFVKQLPMSIDAWMGIKLPEGKEILSFYAFAGYEGGFFITPQVILTDCSDLEYEYRFAGLVTRVSSDYAHAHIEFDSNHKPKMQGVPINNHTIEEYLKVLEIGNDGWYAIMLSEKHMLYTDAQAEARKQSGLKPYDFPQEVEYWYFWYVKEDADYYYCIRFNTEVFSEEEAESIAKSVRIKK